MRYITLFFKLIFDKNVYRGTFHYVRALIYITKHKDYDKAIREFSFILEEGLLTKSENLIYTELGKAHYWNKNYDKAEVALRKALNLNMQKKGHDSELYQYLAYTYYWQRKFEQSLMFFEKAASFGKEGFFNKRLTNLELVDEMKENLEKHKDKLPFMTAYFEQNKDSLRPPSDKASP